MHPVRLIETQAGLVILAIATAVVLVALSVALFLSPAWVSFEQDRSQANLWTGWPPVDVHRVSTDVLHDLVVGPPTFAQVDPGGAPVFTERERSHLRDVRAVFSIAAVAAFAALVIVLISAVVAARSPERRQAFWRAVRAGALGLGATVVGLGAVALAAFDTAFDIFHRLFFASGSYTFDPRTDRLVQLFPDAFWSETTIALGAVLLALAAIVAIVAGRRLARAGDTASSRAPVGLGPGVDPVRGSRP
jgi:integral membrane protein (TIGR01906 family)